MFDYQAELLKLSDAIWLSPKTNYTGTELADMIDHLLNGHSADAIIQKFDIARTKK